MDKSSVVRFAGKYAVPAAVDAVVVGLAVSVGAFIGSLRTPATAQAQYQSTKTSQLQPVVALIKPIGGAPGTDRSDEEIKWGGSR